MAFGALVPSAAPGSGLAWSLLDAHCPTTHPRNMNDWDASDLAWALADAIAPLLADGDRARIYAIVGSGESDTAIGIVLQTVARRGLSLPPELIAKLADWLGAYAHSDDASRLQRLLRAIEPSPTD